MGYWGWPAEMGEAASCADGILGLAGRNGGGGQLHRWDIGAGVGRGPAWGIGALAFARSQPRGERGDAVLLKGRRGKRAPKTREKGACGAHGSSSIAGQC